MTDDLLPQGRWLATLRVLAIFLVTFFIAAFCFDISEEYRLSYTMPTKPDPGSGFIYAAHVNHGLVYLNEVEVVRRNRVYWLFVAAIAAFGAAALMQRHWELFPPYDKRRISIRATGSESG